MAVKRWRGELAGTWHDEEEENQTRRLGIYKTMTLADGCYGQRLAVPKKKRQEKEKNITVR